jgi:hypothetical protein
MGHLDPKNVTVKLTQIFLTIALFVLGLRVLFSLLDADLTNNFVGWIYATSVTLMYPFRGIFSVEVATSDHVLEVAVIFAMAAYALLAAVVKSLVVWLPEAKTAKK